MLTKKKDLIDKRDNEIFSDFKAIYKEGMKRIFCYNQLAQKYFVGYKTISEVVIRKEKEAESNLGN